MNRSNLRDNRENIRKKSELSTSSWYEPQKLYTSPS